MENNKHLPKILYVFSMIIAFCLIFSKQYAFGAAVLAITALSIAADLFLLPGMRRGNMSMHKGASNTMAENLPFPSAIVNGDGKILWYNHAMQEMLSGKLLSKSDITSFFPSLSLSESHKAQTVLSGGKTYEVFVTPALSEAWGGALFLYFADVTDKAELSEKLKNEKTCVMLIYVDNYEEVKKSAAEEDVPSISGKLQKVFIAMANEGKGILKRLERDKFLYILNYKTFLDMKNKKFSVTEAVKEAFRDFPMAPTLSIGIGIDGESFEENDSFSSAALDMALGRGGDQVVIRNRTNFEYFGGKTKAVERRSKVRARVVAHALRELIGQNDRVVMMGHPSPDIDCIGAAVALSCYCIKSGTPAHIVFDGSDKTVNAVIEGLKTSAEWQNVFIKGDAAREYVNSKTLLIILDTHRASFTQVPALLAQTGQIAVVDHHRRGADFIDNSLLLYHEPYASSTCEMVVEMLQYMSDKQVLSAAEATAAYAGIYLDTKSFSLKTGVRTLEAAAYLRRCGVDPIEVKKLFRSSFETVKEKNRLIQSAVILKNKIAVVKSGESLSQSVIAQVADELINISDIDTSFVIAPVASHFSISARSSGNINVQVIMEKMGGGGHMSVAGAQIEAENIDEAEKMLLKVIDEYLAENE